MIGGVVEHDGHLALAVHLARHDDNETISVQTFGLSSETVAEALDELKLMAIGCRTSKPLLHAWASPSIAYTEAEWHRHRDAFEAEFGLVGFPHIEVTHRKIGAGGRTSEHKHLVYLRIDADGKAARMSHSGARTEKISRICEVRNGERLTSGRFNDSVIAHLQREGLHDVAQAMQRAGLGGTIANSAPSSAERAMTERLTDIASDEVWRRAANAWKNSDSGTAFRAALMYAGLRLAIGDTCVVVVSPNGAVHPLLRAINKGGEGIRLRKAELAERLSGLVIPAIKDLPAADAADPGVFAITGLNRQPSNHVLEQNDVGEDVAALPVTRDTPSSTAQGLGPSVVTEPVGQMRELSQEQLAALMAFDELLHSGARQHLEQMRAEIERDVLEAIARRRDEELKSRISEEARRYTMPSLGEENWKRKYKADLAGLPADYGAMLRWVEARDAERRHLVLTSGITIDLTPSCAKASMSADETIDILVAHAIAQGWARVRVTGGEQDWREKLAVASTRAGLHVINKKLADVVYAEHRRLDAERLVEAWRLARSAVFDCEIEPTRRDRLAFADALAQLTAWPDILEFDWPEPEASALADDLEQYRQYQEHHIEYEHGPRTHR